MRRETLNPGSQLPILVGDNKQWPGNRCEEYTALGEQGVCVCGGGLVLLLLDHDPQLANPVLLASTQTR